MIITYFIRIILIDEEITQIGKFMEIKLQYEKLAFF